ncbi:MAG: DNA polymerase III subunit alpha, partial [Myxococcales bacterium]|nr:DNA polymerase III subunit alpha [Myxococcales bacterium]
REGAYHLVLLATNATGYQNLCRLVSKAYLEGYYYKPRIDRELLEKHNEGLIALSACLSGELNTRLMKGERREALAAAGWYKEVFDDQRFFVEVQDNGLIEQDKCNGELIRIAHELDLPLVATNDAHYLRREDVRAHEILLCVGTASSLTDAKRLKFHADNLYVKTPEEMAHAFRHLPQAVKNTLAIAERCDFEMQFGNYQFPKFDIPQGETLETVLEQEARRGLARRLPEIERLEGAGFDGRKGEYEARLALELEVINGMGFASYFLIVSDFVRHAKSRSIPVGPGRGSAAGSLVAYCLEITDINPIYYNLLFERFLNPERISMPDIDMDFCRDRRDEVIDYVTRRYGGTDYVAQIITFGTMQAKAAIRDVGRALGMSYGDVDKIAKLVPNQLNITLEEAFKAESEFERLRKETPQVDELLTLAQALEGLTRHASTHAAGVVIGSRPLVETLPLYKDPKGGVVTQFSMNHVEKVGLIKFDFLG